MKIALFSDTYLPDINGVVTSVFTLKLELMKLGHEVYVITNHHGIGILKEDNVIKIPGIELKKLYGYKASSPFSIVLNRELKKYNFDIVHVHTEFGVGILGASFAKNNNIPLVRTYHTTYEDYTHYLNPINSTFLDDKAKKMIVAWSKSLAKHCSLMIAPSVKTKTLLESYGVKTRIEVVPTGVDWAQFKKYEEDKISSIKKQFNFKEDDKIFGYIGRVAKEKAVDFIIEAFSMIDKSNVKLLIVGSGPDLDEFKEFVSNNNLDEIIYFAGKVPHDEISNYYHLLDAFISASISETQGMTYIEALSSETIVLARNDQAVLDLVIHQENGYIYDNVEELIKYINLVCDLSNEEISQLKENALKSSLIYDSNEFGIKVSSLYQEVLNENRNGFVIESVKLKKDHVEINVCNVKNDCRIISLSLDDYLNYGLRKGKELDVNIINELLNKEKQVLAYQKALKHLMSKITSKHDFINYMKDNFYLNEDEINDIVLKCQDIGLINDEEYVKSKLYTFKTKLMSKKTIKYKLKEAGISEELIKKTINEMPSEKSVIDTLALKYQKQLKSKSVAAIKQSIINKLVLNGFKMDEILESVNKLDFSKQYSLENESIIKELNKLKRKYSNKYSGSELRNKLFHALYTKGYKIESIYVALDTKEYDD